MKAKHLIDMRRLDYDSWKNNAPEPEEVNDCLLCESRGRQDRMCLCTYKEQEEFEEGIKQ